MNAVGANPSRAWRRFRANRRAFWSLVALAALFAASLFAPSEAAGRIYPASALDPHLRPEKTGGVHYPVAACELRPDGTVGRAWGDTERFADALAAVPVEKLRASGAPEITENGVSFRISPGGSGTRVYLRPAGWRSGEGETRAADSETALEPAVFPFRPVPGHPMGFDAAGRDVFARIAVAARIALSFGLLLTAASLLIGVAVGAVQGFFAGWTDLAGQRLTEIWSAIPFLYVMIFLGNALGRSFGVLLAGYAAFNWIGVAAYTRAEFLRLRGRAFVDAARLQGLGDARIMFRHILPNALTPIVTLAPFLLIGAVGSLTALDYLGFGLPDGTPSWGELLHEAQSFRSAWWLVVHPAAATFFFMLLGAFIGEGLRDAFDAKADRPAFGGAPARKRGAEPPVARSGDRCALRVENLRLSFDTPEGEVRAVDGVSFALAPGETLGLVGESGSGKSVTALSVLGLCPGARRVSGSILVGGREVADMSPRELRALRGGCAGMVFQDPMSALSPLHRVGGQMIEALRLHGDVTRREALARAGEWLARCGIADPGRVLREYPFRLSGGMQQRVMIASALMTRPALLIADEPTTALDVTTQAQVLDLMRDLREKDTAMLFISHNLAVVRRVCSRVAVMQRGRIVEEGPCDEVFAHPKHEYTKHLLACIPGERTPPAPVSAAAHGETALAMRNVVKTFGKTAALGDVSLELHDGETLAVVGESGSGKTTLARIAAGLESATSGEVVRPRRGVQMVFQDPYASLNPRICVGTQIVEGAVRAGVIAKADSAREAGRWLAAVGLDETYARRFPHELSGGQLQRVSIARALAMRPSVLLCDEAVSALDVSVQAQILELLAQIKRELRPAMLFITHDLAVVREIADSVIVMHGGKIVERGSARDVVTAPRDSYTRALLAAEPRIGR